MNKVCIGCGSKFQTLDKNKEGYINPKVYDKATLCERCFKIKYYGETYVTDNPKDKTTLIKMINDSKKSNINAVTLIKDIENSKLNKSNFLNVYKYISIPLIIVLIISFIVIKRKTK